MISLTIYYYIADDKTIKQVTLSQKNHTIQHNIYIPLLPYDAYKVNASG